MNFRKCSLIYATRIFMEDVMNIKENFLSTNDFAE